MQTANSTQQAINAALTAYIVNARALTCTGDFSAVFEMMYKEDADTIEAALQEYNTTNDIAALRSTIAEMDDDGAEQVYAYLQKHAHDEALAALAAWSNNK